MQSNYPPEYSSGQIAELEGDRKDPLRVRKGIGLDYWRTAPKLSESKEAEPKEEPKTFNCCLIENVYPSTSRTGAFHVVKTTGKCLASADSIVYGVPTQSGFRKMDLVEFCEWTKKRDRIVIKWDSVDYYN